METVKKTYEEPTVQKVEFDFKTRIAASNCRLPDMLGSNPDCSNQ